MEPLASSHLRAYHLDLFPLPVYVCAAFQELKLNLEEAREETTAKLDELEKVRVLHAVYILGNPTIPHLCFKHLLH